MPSMPRIPGKATRIAYDILGVPGPLKSRVTKKQKRVRKRLNQENTRLIR